MEEKPPNQTQQYILGHAEDELGRLIYQARYFGDLTGQLLQYLHHSLARGRGLHWADRRFTTDQPDQASLFATALSTRSADPRAMPTRLATGMPAARRQRCRC